MQLRRTSISAALVSLGVAAIACQRAHDDDGATRASVAGLEPTLHDGDPTCADLGYAHELDDRPVSQIRTLSGDGVDVTVTQVGDRYFDWTATAGIGAVVVFGGPVPNISNVYTYDPPSVGDTGLHAPINVPQGQGKPYGSYGTRFCFDLPLDGGRPDAGGATEEAGAAEDAGAGEGDAMAW